MIKPITQAQVDAYNIAKKQAAYDNAMNDPVNIAMFDSIADAITSGLPITPDQLRANGRKKI